MMKNSPALAEWVTAFAASSLAIRTASSADGWPARWRVISRRTWLTRLAWPWNVRWYRVAACAAALLTVSPNRGLRGAPGKVQARRAHRSAHGWTQADLAAKTSYSESLIAQVETCRKAPTAELARALDRVFATPGFTEDAPGVPGTPGTFGRLVVRLRNLPFPVSFRSFAPHEAEATALYTFEHSLIPGLLQTEAYARAILETHPDAIPNAGVHLGLLGAFTVADLGGSPGIVNIEDITEGRVTEDAGTVSMVALRFHSLRGDALSKGTSRDLIEGVIQERWQETAP
jgi:transcriptional regulator with XRE-family HTH domain